MCKHTKLKLLVTSLALQQLREVDAVTKQKHVSMIHDIKCMCKIQWYTTCMLYQYINIRNSSFHYSEFQKMETI